VIWLFVSIRHVATAISSIYGSTALFEPWPLLQFRNLFYTDGRTTWSNDQPVARPLPPHRTQTE
jgi:hypothetical protein